MANTYNFGDNITTKKIKGVECTVIKTPEFEASKKAMVSLFESELGQKAKITTADTWIQENLSKDKKYVIFSRLILTHTGYEKLNEALPKEKQFDPSCVAGPIDYVTFDGAAGVYYEYKGKVYALGECNAKNCFISYPLSVAYKRMFDNAVGALAGLFGIYSDSAVFDEGVEAERNEEVIENLAAKPVKKVSAKKEEAKEEAPVAIDMETGEVAEMALEEALLHTFEGLTKKDGKGYGLKALLQSANSTDEEKMARLQMFADKGSEKDQLVCKLVIDAIKNGEVKLTNSKK